MKYLYLSCICILFLLTGTHSNAQCLSNWTYSSPITITNSNPTALVNFQVKVVVNTSSLISAGHMLPGGEDIRFTQGNCCNFLCYAIESGMNTTTTNIWIKIDSIPASGSTIIDMNYGNPSAVAGENAGCTFDLWEPFDNAINHFAVSCGSGTYSVAGGIGSMSWSSQHMAISDITFDMDTVYTAEMKVNAASGNWPGINFSGIGGSAHYGYSMLLGSGVRIGKSGTSAPDYCRGENWASTVYPPPISSVGIWSITWIATGSITGDFPFTGTLTSTDIEHTRNQDMKVCIGGISSGTGSMDMDWIRVRKYAPLVPGFSVGAEGGLAFQTVSLGPDTSLCDINNLILDAGSGFVSYTWSTSDMTQTTTVNSPGTYFVNVIDASSCPSSDTITVAEFPPVNVNLGSDQSICPGDTLILDAGAGFTNYSWSSGGNAQLENATDSADYIVDVIDANGCAGSDTITVSVFPQPTAAFTFNSVSLATTFTNTSTGGNTYFWDFDDGNTSTAMDTVHVFSTPGTYNVCLTVTNTDGCTDISCSSVTVTNTSVENELENAGITLYPNPASDHIWINTLTEVENAEVKLIDVSGRTLFVRKFKTLDNQVLDITGYSAGMYVVEIVSGMNTYYSSIIIK